MSPDFDDVADGCTGKAAPSPRNIWTIPKGKIAVHNNVPRHRDDEPASERAPTAATAASRPGRDPLPMSLIGLPHAPAFTFSHLFRHTVVNSSRMTTYPNRSRASRAPAPSAASLAAAMSRRIGAIPQLVQGMIRSRGT